MIINSETCWIFVYKENYNFRCRVVLEQVFSEILLGNGSFEWEFFGFGKFL